MKVGFTTTIPVEIILAAGHVPVDLNNVFVSHSDAQKLMRRAELDGYPRNVCSWIKGIYGTVMELEPVDKLIMVTEGDCANTQSMSETFALSESPPGISFAFPRDRNENRLDFEMEKLAREMGTSMEHAERCRRDLKPVRKDLSFLDKLTWKTGQVKGSENHRWLLSSSDFEGDPEKFHENLRNFLSEAVKRPVKNNPGPRLAFTGVPPIFTDLHEYLEEKGAGIVLNEMQRQFSMPYDCDSLTEQYLLYRYPYDVFFRLEDLKKEISKRRIQGVIHYVQAFCHRGIEDVVLRRELDVPFVTLEGDVPGPLDARTKLRLDIFLEMLA